MTQGAAKKCGCGKPVTKTCVECGEVACDECATAWVGNICWRCQDNPVFFDTYSRVPGEVDRKHGGIDHGRKGD